MKIEEREGACFEFLKELPTDSYILIGGYATSAFDFPRFSLDLDLVIKEKDLDKFINLLEKQGYELKTKGAEVSQLYKGSFMRYEKKVNKLAIGIDLLVNAVHSRQTNASYSFNYLFQNSELRDVIGSTLELKVVARVADREMLIALKVNSMRLPDQRDIIALCTQEVVIHRVAKHLKRCPKDIILEHIGKLLETIRSPKHKDSIKGVFSLSDRVYERIIARTEKAFEKLYRILEGAN